MKKKQARSKPVFLGTGAAAALITENFSDCSAVGC